MGDVEDNDVDDDKYSESEDSDFVNSDYNLNDEDMDDGDNMIFKKYVDKEVERDMHRGTVKGTEINDEDSDVSVYANSDDIDSCSMTDDDGGQAKYKPNFPEFNTEVDMANPVFKIGLKFASFKQFKEAVKESAIKNRQVMIFKPNNK